MKALLITAAVVLSTTAQANCGNVYNAAETMMKARQAGVPLSKVIELADGSEAITALAMDAYEGSRYSTPSIKQKVITEFANKWMLICMKAK